MSKAHIKACLKSNMDRFIAVVTTIAGNPLLGIKSNMDRFIAQIRFEIFLVLICLKSNMDRFIVFAKRTI